MKARVRRTFCAVAAIPLTVTLLGSTAGERPPAPRADPLPLMGCLLSGGGQVAQMPPAVPSVYGWVRDPVLARILDAQLSGVAATLANVYHLHPSIRYYNDGGSPNGFAVPILTEPGTTDGSVRIGVNLVAGEANRFLQSDYGRTRLYTYSITAVMAHEMGHILQIHNGSGSPGRNTELEADFIAGWYFSYLAANDPQFSSNAGLEDGIFAFFSRGDYYYNNPSHHGTPEQRKAAFMAGYEVGARDVDEAWTAAEAFRRQL